MSLKYFHLFFIACSIGLMAFLLNWSKAHEATGLGVTAWVGAVASVAYLAWFLRRYQTLR